MGLKSNPRPIGVKKLEGVKNRYRIRQGKYRMVYAIDEIEKVISILLIKHRKDVYQDR